MGTPANVHFLWDNGTVAANIYRHWDGYPSEMLKDLKRFFTAVEKATGDTRFNDPEYLAAKYVVWQAGEYGTGLDFLSVGVVNSDNGEYIYNVHCNDGRPRVELANG